MDHMRQIFQVQLWRKIKQDNNNNAYRENMAFNSKFISVTLKKLWKLVLCTHFQKAVITQQQFILSGHLYKSVKVVLHKTLYIQRHNPTISLHATLPLFPAKKFHNCWFFLIIIIFFKNPTDGLVVFHSHLTVL